MITAATLPPNYTKQRPVRFTTSNVLASIHKDEVIWAIQQWSLFQGGPEDQIHNVIMEVLTPRSKVRLWVVDRDGPDSDPMLMLPSDY